MLLKSLKEESLNILLLIRADEKETTCVLVVSIIKFRFLFDLMGKPVGTVKCCAQFASIENTNGQDETYLYYTFFNSHEDSPVPQTIALKHSSFC